MRAVLRTLNVLGFSILAAALVAHVFDGGREAMMVGVPLSVALVALHRSYLKDPAHD